MKGKNNFTAHEALAIMGLLRLKRENSALSQKYIRDTLRSKGFYISNYGQNLTPEDFDNLIVIGKIIITEHLDFYNEQKASYIKGNKDSSSVSTQLKKEPSHISKDEHYILDLCDEVLNQKCLRQHRFHWLKGDANKNGISISLPVDAYYPNLKLVVEYKERQHTEEIKFFDKPDKITVSGVSRGEQRRIYDQRRIDLIPQQGLKLIELSYDQFNHNTQKRLLRDYESDKKIISKLLASFL